jgi:hypothetical protein
MSDPTWYPVRLGPLRFAALVGPESETLGDKLEAVGSAMVPGERTAKTRSLVLPIRGSVREVDDRAAGERLRRQIRALLGNRAWLSGGLYLESGADPESRCWLAVGSGDLTANGRGITFGDWRLTLEAYSVGTPATVRRGRRIVIADRAEPGIASDTRRTLYTTDRASWATTGPKAYLPRDIRSQLQSNREPWVATDGPAVDGKSLWYESVDAAVPGGISWIPNPARLPGAAEREPRAEERGEVRTWWLPAPYATTATTAAGDRDPTLYGWERVYGQLHDESVPVAVDNGWCRAVWLGPDSSQGLQLERWGTANGGRYVPVLRVLHRGDSETEVRVIELTAERVVLSWIAQWTEMRLILQRGWPGPRIEAYPQYRSSPGVFNMITGPGTADRSTLEPGVELVTTGGGAALLARANDPPAAGPAVYQVDLHASGASPSTTTVKRLARWDVQPQPILMTR